MTQYSHPAKGGQDRVVRAALALIRHWKKMGNDSMEWGHRGHWFPLSSERQCKALINACIAYRKRR